MDKNKEPIIPGWNKPKPVTSFVVTMYCNNCRNYSDVRFPIGTVVKDKKLGCPICGIGVLQ